MSKMYNAEQKQMYLDSLPKYKNKDTNNRVRILFEKLSEQEEYYGDICDMSLPQAKISLSMLGQIKHNSKGNMVTIIRSYVDWCIANGKSKLSENYIDLIKPEDLNSTIFIKYRYVCSDKQIRNFIDVAFGDEQFMVKAMVWLLWLGFDQDTIPSIKKTDIDFENKSINHNGFTANNIPDDVMLLFNNCIHADSIIRGGRFETSTLKLLDSEYLIRGAISIRSSKSLKYRSIRIAENVCNYSKLYREITGERFFITAKRIWLSGAFRRIYETRNYNNIVTDDIIVKELRLKDLKLNFKNNALLTLKRKDYLNWVKAFELN